MTTEKTADLDIQRRRQRAKEIGLTFWVVTSVNRCPITAKGCLGDVEAIGLTAAYGNQAVCTNCLSWRPDLVKKLLDFQHDFPGWPYQEASAVDREKLYEKARQRIYQLTGRDPETVRQEYLEWAKGESH